MANCLDTPEDDRRGGRAGGADRGSSVADELRTAIQTGSEVRRGAGEPAAEGHGWGDERTVPAELLYELLARPETTTRPRAAVLAGVRVSGRLNFEAVELQAPLIAHGCYFDHPINLMNAKASEVRLTACHMPGIAGDGLETRGDLDLAASTLDVLGLLSARIGRDLVLAGATLGSAGYPLNLGSGTLRPREAARRPVEGIACAADGLRVDRQLSCDGFSAAGQMRLVGAEIAGALSFRGATLHGGLMADNLQVDQNVFCDAGFSAAREIRLLGGHIGGGLLLSGATLDGGLTANNVRVDRDVLCDAGFSAVGDIDLARARIGAVLSFNDAALTGQLICDNLRVDEGMFCRADFTTDGTVRLDGAHIGGQLSFDGAMLRKGLSGDGLRVDGSLVCGMNFSAGGTICLNGAHIGGQLVFEGAALAEGLRGGGLQVGEGMYCDGAFTARAPVQLRGARIGAQLTFDGALLASGLDGDRLQVVDGMYCRAGFVAEGPVRLPGARIDGGLSFTGATLSGSPLALGLEDARVGGPLFLHFARRPAGAVDLTDACLGTLLDSERTWPVELRLRGCVYGGVKAVEDRGEQPGAGQVGEEARPPTDFLRRLRRGMPPDVRRRLQWIQRAEDANDDDRQRRRVWRRQTGAGSPRGARYAPQPYTQLAAVYQQEGRDSDARRVVYERERRRESRLGVAGRVWKEFLRWTVGYGYRPLRALWLLGLLVLVGTLLFSSFHDEGELTAVRSAHPPFVAAIYTIDRLIPVVSFGLRDAFAPSGPAQWWAFGYTLLGWALTIAVVAGLNAAVRRD